MPNHMQKIEFIPKFIFLDLANLLFSIALGMSDHHHWKLLNIFVTRMDP